MTEEVHTITVVVEPLPFPFADDNPGTLWMWMFKCVMEHTEAPINQKTLDFIDDACARAMSHSEGRIRTKLEVVK
jgi:hypothetical protein